MYKLCDLIEITYFSRYTSIDIIDFHKATLLINELGCEGVNFV